MLFYMPFLVIGHSEVLCCRSQAGKLDEHTGSVSGTSFKRSHPMSTGQTESTTAGRDDEVVSRIQLSDS